MQSTLHPTSPALDAEIDPSRTQAKAIAGLQAKALLDWMQNRVGDEGEVSFRDVLRLGPSATRRLDAAEAGETVREEVDKHGLTFDLLLRHSPRGLVCLGAALGFDSHGRSV
jgi:hypothetical protein